MCRKERNVEFKQKEFFGFFIYTHAHTSYLNMYRRALFELFINKKKSFTVKYRVV